MTKPSCAELARKVADLEVEVARSQRYARINRSLFQIADAVSSSASLAELFPAIHRSLSAIIDTTNFFIALYDEAHDLITFPYAIDVASTDCSPMSGVTGKNSLTARVLESRQPLLIDRAEIERQRAETGWAIVQGKIPEIWLGVPLVARDVLIGAMVVQSYEGPSFYDLTDVETLNSVAAQAAVAIERKRIEERLQESEGRFRMILENVAEISIQGYDERRRVTFWNPASEKLYGYSEREALGRRLEDLIIPSAMREDVITMIAGWVAGGEPIPAGELMLVDKYGRDAPVFSSHVLCESAGGKEMFCIDLDLKPIKQAEKMLREANAKFHAAMDSLDAIVYVADMQSHELLFLNTKTRQMSNAEVGDTCWAALQDGQTGPCPFCTNDRLIDADGRPTPPYVWEVRNTRSGRWFQCRDQAIRWPDGRLVRLEIAIDITERKAMEEVARESADRFKTFFSAINDAVLVHPLIREGFAPFIEVNDIACERYGYSREEFLRLSVLDINRSECIPVHSTAKHRRMMLEKRHLVFETVNVKKSGEEFPVEINANIVEQGGKPFVLAVVRDISERKNSEREREKLEDQLRQAQKLESIGRLAGGVAHDFNNMLGVILGRTEMIMDDVPASFAYLEDLDEIRKAATRSADLTRQLLAFARKQTISPQIVDLNEKVADIHNMLRRMIGEDIELSWQPSRGGWLVKIDPGQVDQILTNLCVNARDAITGRGRIAIGLANVEVPADHDLRAEGARPGQFVVLRVEDNGCGMGKDVLENLFEPFFTTKPIGRGTGLGLATLYGIVRQNNGFIDVQSRPGQGSIFRIYLPRCEAAGTEPTAVPPVPWTMPEKSISVLLVEDEAAILAMARTMLVRLGFQVHVASSPRQALSVAAECAVPLDILITDIVMPEMDGWQLAEKIAILHPGISRLLMSGYNDDVVDTGELPAPGVNFIRKPFTKNELANILSKILRPD